MNANEIGANEIGTNDEIKDAKSLFHWIQSDLLYNYMDILENKEKHSGGEDVNKLLTPAEKHALAQFIVPLDAVYENRFRSTYTRNYHHGLHSSLTIYQKIHDPFFRVIKYLENDRLLFFDTLAILTEERMEIVEHGRNDTQPVYTQFMWQFFQENGTAQAIYAAACTLPKCSAPLVYAAVAARVVLLSWIGAYAEIKKLVAAFQHLYERGL